MERDPRLLELKLAAKYTGNYSYPARLSQAPTSMPAEFIPRSPRSPRPHRSSIGSESSNPGMVPDQSSDSDFDTEEEVAYLGTANQLWDSFWAPKETQARNNPHKHLTMGSTANKSPQPLYQSPQSYIMRDSVDPLPEPAEDKFTAPEWPLPTGGISPSVETGTGRMRQHCSPSRARCHVPLCPALSPKTSNNSLSPQSTSFSRPVSPMSPFTARLSQKPSGLVLPSSQIEFKSFSAPVTPAVHTPVDEFRPLISHVNQTLSRSNSRTRSNTHEPSATAVQGPSGSTLSKAVSTPDLKRHMKPRTVPLKENGTRAPYYQEVSYLSSLPPPPENAPIQPAMPLLSRSSTNLRKTSGYMDDIPPMPHMNSSKSSPSALAFMVHQPQQTNNVSVWEDDSDDEDTSKPSGLSRILMPSAHKRSVSRESKRPSSREGQSMPLSPSFKEVSGKFSRKRSETMLARMLGRRSR